MVILSGKGSFSIRKNLKKGPLSIKAKKAMKTSVFMAFK
jgi:hypothetical protein